MRILGHISYGMLLAASAILAGAFAFDIGNAHSAFFGCVFAFAIGALLILESFLAAKRTWWAVVPVALAIASMEVGFSAGLFSDHAAARKEGARNAKVAAEVEPAPVVRARLEAHEAKHRGVRAQWCTSKREEERKACDTWQALKVDLARAESVEHGAKPSGEADPRAELFARRIGGAVEVWADWLVVLVALALTFGRVGAATVLFKPENQVAAPAADLQPVETVSENLQAPPVEPLKTPKSTPKLPKDAEKVLRVVKAQAGGQDFIGFLPPLSQRALAEKANLPRKKLSDALETLEAAGVVRVAASREGTRIEVLG